MVESFGRSAARRIGNRRRHQHLLRISNLHSEFQRIGSRPVRIRSQECGFYFLHLRTASHVERCARSGSLCNQWVETTGLVQYRSGDSLTPTSGATNVSGTGQNQDRAVVVAGVNAYGGSPCATPTAPCVPFLNSAAFTTPAAGGFGTVQKGSYIGPRYTDWDASLARKFNLTEVSYLQFRAEFFDVLNHTNFLDPNTSAGGSSFGRITGSNDPRIGQLSLKLVF